MEQLVSLAVSVQSDTSKSSDQTTPALLRRLCHLVSRSGRDREPEMLKTVDSFVRSLELPDSLWERQIETQSIVTAWKCQKMPFV